MQSKLYRNGHRFFLSEEQQRALRAIEAPRIVPMPDGGVRTVSKSLLHDDVACLPTLGLRDLIHEQLRLSGHDVQPIASVPLATLPSPNVGSQTSYPSLAQFVRVNATGLIEAKTDFDVDIAAIASLANAYPDCRIMVVGARWQRLNRIARILRSEFKVLVQWGIDRSSQHSLTGASPNLVVSTFLGAADFEIAHCDIVILADAEECSHEQATLMLSQADARFRLFGLMRRKQFHQQPRSIRADLMRVFGVNFISLKSHNRVKTDCQLTWIRNHQNFVDLSIENVNYHRAVVWNNRRRNQKIKSAIQGIRSDDLEHSVILVKSLQHASALSHRLPNWQVWIANSEKQESSRMNGRFRDKAKLLKTDWLGNKAIVTTACAPKYPGFLARSIIWAGSGVQPEIPRSWFFRKDDGVDRPVHIVDFTDGFNEEAHRQARRRRKWYRTNLFLDSWERRNHE